MSGDRGAEEDQRPLPPSARAMDAGRTRPPAHHTEESMNNAQYLERHAELSRLLESARDRLSLDNYEYVADFIEANEFALALEWLVDAFAEGKHAFTPDEIDRIEELQER